MIDWATLPPERFRRALSSGHGRALLHARRLGRVPDEGALWSACLHCQTHDWTLEGHRAPWLWQVLTEAGLARAWSDRLLAALPEATSAPDADQLAGLALCIARSGHTAAVAALEAAVARPVDPTDALPGARELVALQGAAGLRTVLRAVGAALLAGDDLHLLGLGTWMMAAEDILGPRVVAEVLEAADDPASRAVRAAWADDTALPDDDDDLPPARSPQPLTPREHEDLWSQVRACALARVAGRRVPLDDDHLARALARLARHAPGRVDPILLTLDTHDSPAVRRQLSRLYTGVRDPLLRALALQGPLGHPDRLRWMIANHAPGDAAQIRAAIVPRLPADDTHDQCDVLLRLHEAHADTDWSAHLLHVYDRAPSSLHREDALVRLIDDETAPTWLVTEACWDAHPDVAAVARETPQS